MATSDAASLWSWKVEQFLRDAVHSDNELLSNTSARELCAEQSQTIPVHSVNAYSSSLHDYLQHVRVVGAEDETELSPHQKAPFGGSSSASIISIRGLPDCSLIRLLGTKFNIDPDVLLGHLSYPHTIQARATSPIPNSSINILLISVGSYRQHDATDSQESLDAATEASGFHLFKDGSWGHAQYHRINLHRRRFCSVEQQVTFIVHEKRDTHWSGILLNNSSEAERMVPWLDYAPFSIAGARFLPLKQHASPSRPPGPLRREEGLRVSSSRRRPDPCLSRAHHGTPMTDIERDLCLQDPMLFAADLLKTSALSWKFFFNFLFDHYQSLRADPDLPNSLYGTPQILPDPAISAERFRRDMAVVERARRYFGDVVTLIKRRDRLGWPTCAKESDRATADSIIAALLEDFISLQTEASELCATCNASITIEMNMISITDSKKSIEQSERIQKLTHLAYLFIPLTFVCGIFGMNVKEINDAKAPIWAFFVTAIPLTACFALIPQWHIVENFMQNQRPRVRRKYWEYKRKFWTLVFRLKSKKQAS